MSQMTEENKRRESKLIVILKRNTLNINPEKQKSLTNNIKRMIGNNEKGKFESPEQEQKNLLNKKTQNFKAILALLRKGKNERTKIDGKVLAIFMCEKYNFFKKMKEDSHQEKVEALIDVLHLEVFQKGDKIINFGEDGNKFYILLEGSVGIYRPKMVEKNLSLAEFVTYLKEIKLIEKNDAKLKRIEEANMKTANMSVIKLYNYDYTKMIDPTAVRPYYIEEDLFLVEKGEGEEFGEVALIQKIKRTATVTAHTLCQIVSIEKYDYNHTIKKLEEKKFNLVIDDLKKSYRIISNWSKPLLVKLMGGFSKMTFGHGDILYDQNSNEDDIFFTISGHFELKSYVSISSIKGFIDYINNSKSSLVTHLIKHGRFVENELGTIKANLRKHSGKFKLTHAVTNKILTRPVNGQKLIDIKLMEEDFKNGKEVFSVNIKVIESRDVIGLEEALELKSRFYTVRCISNTAEVYKIKLDHFLSILNASEIQKTDINTYIVERKEALIKQIKNTVKIKVRNKQRILEHQYNKFLNEDSEMSERNNKVSKGIIIHKSELMKSLDSYSPKRGNNKISLNPQQTHSERRPKSSLASSEKAPNIVFNNNLDITKNFSNFKMFQTDSTKKRPVYKKKNISVNLMGSESVNNSHSPKIRSIIDKTKTSEKIFDSIEYRNNLVNLNFEEIKGEISKVIGTSIIYSPKMHATSKTFERKLLSINSVQGLNDDTPVTLRNSNFNTINKDSQRDNDYYKFEEKFDPNEKSIITFSSSINKSPGVKIFRKISPLKKIVKKSEDLNNMTPRVNKRYVIPIEIKMKYFKNLRRNKKLFKHE